MKDILFYGIGCFVCLQIGIWGFAQIYGSIEYRKVRSITATLFTLILWLLILGGVILAIVHWFSAYKVAYLIALGVGCLISCRHQEV